ncbi:MAG: 3-deoxy-8-phosphooctulonate synthase [Planctomycetota bacterium]
MSVVRIGSDERELRIGAGQPLAVIGGPCVLEGEALCREVGERLREACAALGFGYVFKTSFDKANRSSLDSARGPGLDEGLATLVRLRDSLGVAVTSDVHAPEQAGAAAEVLDVLQIPAFLCRQTDLLVACGRAAGERERSVNIKKGQFLAPAEMAGPVRKVRAAGCSEVIATERGTFFGYHRLVNDFIGLGDLLELDVDGGLVPVCFDATHSAQLPGAGADGGRIVTAGRRDRVELLARSAVAAGVHAVFLEVHPDPDRAMSDASTMLPLERAPVLLEQLARIRDAVGV